MIRPENLQQLQLKWQELPDSNEGEKLKKIICVDGKTMRSNKRVGTKPCHIVSAGSREDGYYISSLSEDIELFRCAVRGHWAVESMHWNLDVTFKEDANTTLDKTRRPRTRISSVNGA